MALFPDRHPLLRQPSDLSRVNPRHWLAKDLVAVGAGGVFFLNGEPQPAPVYRYGSYGFAGAHHPALNGAHGYRPDGAITGEPFNYGFSLTTYPSTLAAWHYGTTSGTLDVILSARSSTGATVGGVEIGRSAAGLSIARARNTSGSLGTATGSISVTDQAWHQTVGVFVSSGSRFVYTDGADAASNTTSITPPTTHNRIQVGNGTTGASVVLPTTVYGVALPMIIARVLDAEEVERLHTEQRSNPWVLFTERPIWVPVSAASGAPTISDLKAASITSTSVQATYDYTF